MTTAPTGPASSSKTTRRRRKVKRLAAEFGVPVADTACCPGHADPLTFLTAWVYDRPSVSVVHGPRGGGKSYLAALATHIDSLRYDRHGTRVLGGSLAQSQQIYTALRDFDATQPGDMKLTKTTATYSTGSDVSVLAASRTSVRGPHVATLRLDEVDEIDEDIRESSLGMCMAMHGVSASVSMTSTWHRMDGPMGLLKERADAGEMPWWSFCAFEILERCPDERSGPNLEHCPECPLVRWCHDTQDTPTPRAKRSNGHYAIDSLIQKTRAVSLRVFESDYLCLGPRADGLWFPQFEPSKHVSASAEYDPDLPVHLAVDSGVQTGAVFYQSRHDGWGNSHVTVFADYLSFGLPAENNARAILRAADTFCEGRFDHTHTDPAGGADNPVGPKVLDIYRDAGLPLDRWPVTSVSDGLSLVESFVENADGQTRIAVHPRCRHLITAFRSYRRKKHQGQWTDRPEDPQHPHEDVMDALRGGLMASERPAASYGANPFPGR